MPLISCDNSASRSAARVKVCGIRKLDAFNLDHPDLPVF